MRQRVLGWWGLSRRPGEPPRLLIEDADSALAVSDFSRFADAGFTVAHCSGPGTALCDCPLLRGRPCELVAGADVVLHRLSGYPGIVAGIRQRHPEVVLVTIRPRRAAHPGEPGSERPGDLAVLYPDSDVDTQIRALRAALVSR